MIDEQRVLQTFLDLVSIDNPSGQEQQMAAAVIERLQALGRIDEETTANVGMIQGGAATNIVPEQVTLRAEARSRDEHKLERQVAAMRAACETAAERHGTTVDWQSTRAYGPLRIADDAPVVTLCRRAARAAGFEPRLVATGGGSDVNIFNMHGIEAVNLSVGYKDIHSTSEHIAVDDVVGAARFVAALLTVEP